MARVYISFLGTNDYLECIYKSAHDEISKPVRFVQETTLDLFARHATEKDRAFIFLTDEARRKNWDDDGQWDRKNNCPKKCQGLKTRIELMNLPFQVMDEGIPDGHDEDQIWEIFLKVHGVLQEKDEVTFDITHAFRSIPLLTMIILNYSKVLKQICLQNLHYGAFEALGPRWEVEKIPLRDRIAPILDLMPLATLSDWATAVDRFIGAGDAKAVSDLARKTALPVMAQTKGKDEAASAVKNISDALDFFSRQITTCRGPQIARGAANVRNALNKNLKIDFVKPLAPLLEHVEKKFSAFNGESVHDGIQAAKWCLDHGMIQQGFTILKETLVSLVLIRCDENEFEKKHREIVSDLFGVMQKGMPKEEWKGHLAISENSAKIEKYIKTINLMPEIMAKWQKLTDCRNDMNHAGYRSEPFGDKTFEPVLKELVELSEGWLANKIMECGMRSG